MVQDQFAVVAEYKAVVPVVSNSFVAASGIIQSTRFTDYGRLSDAVSRGTPLVASAASSAAMNWMSDRAENQFNKNLNWFERNLWVDPNKRAEHERSKNLKTGAVGIAVDIGVQLLGYAGRKYLDSIENDRVYTFIYHSMVMMAGKDIRAIDFDQMAAIDLVLSQLIVQGKQRQRLLSSSTPQSLIDLDPLGDVPDGAKAALFCPAAEVSLISDFKARKNLLFTFGQNKLGLSKSQMEEIIEVLKKDNSARSQYLNALLRLYSKTMLKLEVDPVAVRDRAQVLARFDPLENSRKRNREAALAGAMLGLGLAAGQLPDPGQQMIASAGYALCKEVLASGDGLAPQAIDRAFEQALVEREKLSWLRQLFHG